MPWSIHFRDVSLCWQVGVHKLVFCVGLHTGPLAYSVMTWYLALPRVNSPRGIDGSRSGFGDLTSEVTLLFPLYSMCYSDHC